LSTIADRVLSVLRPDVALTVPQIIRDDGWTLTPDEVSDAISKLRKEDRVEQLSIEDAGSHVPTWRRKAGAA
jgi:hypothetical protein